MTDSEPTRWREWAARTRTAPTATARRLYGWLLGALPPPAARSLQGAVASVRARSGRERPRRTLPLVPIPVHGPDGAGAPLTSPGVLIVAYGLDAPALGDMVDELLAFEPRVADGLRVLVVTDCDAFHVLRRHALLFEYLPPRDAWDKHGFTQPYDDFRAARLQELFAVYAPDRIVHVRSADDVRTLPATMFTAA